MKKLLILCMTTALLLQAQTFELAPNGAAFIKGQNFIKAMQPILWDKSWTNTTVDTKIPADPSLSSVNVSLPVPKTQNTVDFTTVKSTNAAGQSSLSYTAKTQTSLSLNGVCVLAVTSPSVVAGREFVTIPCGLKGVFPAEYQKQSIHTSVDSGIAIKQDDGNYLVLKSNKLSTLLIQDDRVFSINNIQIRFALAPATMRKNIQYTIRFTISTATPEQLDKMLVYRSQAWTPAIRSFSAMTTTASEP